MRPRGFTLIELLIVVAIVGIIAAIAIPNLLSAIQRGKQKRAMREIRSIATACQSYSTDAQIFPIGSNTGWGDSRATNPDLAPDYIRAVPNPDPWGSVYGYAAPAGRSFGVVSTGKNHQLENSAWATVSASDYGIQTTHCFENDIVWVDNGFVLLPEGKQRTCGS